MRNIVIGNGILFKLALVAAALFILCIPFSFVRTQMLIYPLVRQLAKAKMGYETRYMNVMETEHFIIKYTASDEGIVDMVAQAAEAAYAPVTGSLGYAPGKTMIVVYPDRTELRKAFGWSGNESAMGVYWGGAIQILSPREWLKSGETAQEFIHSGPMAHEFTHLVFDYITNGNYPRWFTEGLAQYTEYRVNNYQWITGNNRLDGKLYTMEELDNNFDDLPNEALAYRESLAAVRYIAEVHGEDKLRLVIGSLKNGKDLKAAIQDDLGMDYAAFADAWRTWAVKNMNN